MSSFLKKFTRSHPPARFFLDVLKSISRCAVIGGFAPGVILLWPLIMIDSRVFVAGTLVLALPGVIIGAVLGVGVGLVVASYNFVTRPYVLDKAQTNKLFQMFDDKGLNADNTLYGPLNKQERNRILSEFSDYLNVTSSHCSTRKKIINLFRKVQKNKTRLIVRMLDKHDRVYDYVPYEPPGSIKSPITKGEKLDKRFDEIKSYCLEKGLIGFRNNGEEKFKFFYTKLREISFDRDINLERNNLREKSIARLREKLNVENTYRDIAFNFKK